MMTIGVELGWRHCRVIVLNELGELIPIPPTSKLSNGPAANGKQIEVVFAETAPLIATRMGESQPVVGLDALFALYHEGEWDIQHALAAAARQNIAPLKHLLKQLHKDLVTSGYSIEANGLPIEVRVTTDTAVPIESVKAALKESPLSSASVVPRHEAARAYSCLLVDDEARLSRLASRQMPRNSIVLDLGFRAQCVTFHEEGEETEHRQLVEQQDGEVQQVNRGSTSIRTDVIIDDAFASWAFYIKKNLPSVNIGADAGLKLSQRETYRHFEDWWRQVLPSAYRIRTRAKPREAPFMLPMEITPPGRPFIGCRPDTVLSDIRNAMWVSLQRYMTWTLSHHTSIANWLNGQPLILIGQYSDIPEIGGELAKLLNEELFNQRLTMKTLRLPSIGLAAGAAMAPDEVLLK